MMRAPVRFAHAGIVGVAGAAALVWAATSPGLGAQAGVVVDIYSILERAGSTETTRGTQQSSEGQRFTDGTARHVNPDGSAHESERLCGNGAYTDPLTKNARWYDDGSVSTVSRDRDRDAAGNTTLRTVETTVRKDGSRTTTTMEERFDPQGHSTGRDGNVKRDNVDPNPAACARPYWAGTITVRHHDDFSPPAREGGGFGIGRNQQSTAIDHFVNQDTVTIMLLPLDPLQAPGGSSRQDAIVTREVSETSTEQLFASQELWCDSKWNPWKHEWKRERTAHGSGSGRASVGVSVASDGSYTIGFTSVEATGTVTSSTTDSISPGKCWGTSKHPQESYSGPTHWRENTWQVQGRTDPKAPGSLNGREGDISWNLTRFNPANPK